MPRRLPTEFPATLRCPAGKVILYRGVNRRKWVLYTLIWNLGEGRHRESFSSLEDAVDRGEEIVKDMIAGKADRAITPTRKFLYYRDCEAQLHGVPLADAVKFYLLHHPTSSSSRPLKDVVDDYLKQRLQEALSPSHKRDLTQHLRRLAANLPKKVTEITTSDLDAYLSSMSGSGRTRHNHRVSITGLFRWMADRGIIPDARRTPANKTLAPTIVHADPGIFTPEELRSLLEHAEKEIIPFIVIGAFAGVRPAEIARLTWGRIQWDSKEIVLSREITKTNRRRAAQMPECLLAWLEPFRGRGATLPIVPPRPYLHTQQAAKTAGVKWVSNGLRHSYITYAIALSRNANAVAEQCGNSADVIQHAYKALATQADAERWFAVMPT